MRSLEAQDLKSDPIKLIEKLRKAGHDPELVSQVLTQLKLRSRAVAKFGEFADQMLFTEPGLEQATRLSVAAHHAGRFLEAKVGSVTDLGCGIGADALAFAAAGLEVVAVERDEATAALASFNLAGFENAEVAHADATEFKTVTQGLWFDPARRDLTHTGERHRVLSPEDFTPNLNWVFERARTKPSGVKLGPAFPLELIPEDAHAEWVSNSGDLVELTLWFGMGLEGQRSTLQIGEQSHRYLADQVELAELGSLGQFIYEPDPAMIRSGLMGNLANELSLKTFSPGIAYLTSNTEIHSPWLKGFEVIAALPLDEKKLAAWCREHEIGILEIKKRGVDITPEQLRPKLRLKGTGTATLVLTKVGGARQALFCQPIR